MPISAQKELIRSRYLAGARQCELVEEFGVSKQRISQIVYRVRDGRSRRWRKGRFEDKAPREDVIKRYKSCAEPCSVIAHDLGVSITTLILALRKWGVANRPVFRCRNWGEIAEQYALYLDGMSLREIGKLYNITYMAVSGRFNKLGLPVLPRGFHWSQEQRRAVLAYIIDRCQK